jgi:hypothetical protein
MFACPPLWIRDDYCHLFCSIIKPYDSQRRYLSRVLESGRTKYASVANIVFYALVMPIHLQSSGLSTFFGRSETLGSKSSAPRSTQLLLMILLRLDLRWLDAANFDR